MKQRLLVAAVGVPLLILVLVFLPPLATGLLAAAIAGAAAYELLQAFRQHFSTGCIPSIDRSSCASMELTNISSGNMENSRKYESSAADCGMPSSKKR